MPFCEGERIVVADRRGAGAQLPEGCVPRDYVLVERLWKAVKYEEAYLHAQDFIAVAKVSIGKYLDC